MLLTILSKNKDNLINICTEEIEFGKTHLYRRNPNNNKQKERKKGCHVAIRTWDGRGGGEVIGLGGGSIFALLLLLLLFPLFFRGGRRRKFLPLCSPSLFPYIREGGEAPKEEEEEEEGCFGGGGGSLSRLLLHLFFPFFKEKKKKKKNSPSPYLQVERGGKRMGGEGKSVYGKRKGGGGTKSASRHLKDRR